MDKDYQDIHIINNETKEEKITRLVRVINIAFGTKEIKIDYVINGFYKYLLIEKAKHTLIID